MKPILLASGIIYAPSIIWADVTDDNGKRIITGIVVQSPKPTITQ